jgi:hypothetical protein
MLLSRITHFRGLIGYFSQLILNQLSRFKQKVTNFFKESTSHKNSEGIQFKIIEKLFSKQLRKRATVKKFIDFLFVYVIVVPFITLIFDLYLLVYDSIFGHSSYRSFVLRGQYIIGIYFLFLIVFIDILEVARKSHKIPLTSIIKKSTLNICQISIDPLLNCSFLLYCNFYKLGLPAI